MKWNQIVALGLLAFAFFKFKGGGGGKPDVPIIPDVIPSADFQKVVEPLKAYRGKPKADVVASFYSDFADVVGKDTSIKTKSQFRSIHARAQSVFAEKTDLQNALPGLSPQIDAVFVSKLGLEDGAVDKGVLRDTLSAIAWALGGK